VREVHLPVLREDHSAARTISRHPPRAGASLLAMILYAKFGEHQPLDRQSESFAREGVGLDVSALADWVDTCTASLAPLSDLLLRHVLAAERLHHCAGPG
jgi:transposase